MITELIYNLKKQTLIIVLNCGSKFKFEGKLALDLYNLLTNLQKNDN